MKSLPALPAVQLPVAPQGAEFDALIRAAEQRVQARDERVRDYAAALGDALQAKGTSAALAGGAVLLALLAGRALWRHRTVSRGAVQQHDRRAPQREREASAPARLAWFGPLLLFLLRSPLPSYLATLRAGQRTRADAVRRASNGRGGDARMPGDAGPL